LVIFCQTKREKELYPEKISFHIRGTRMTTRLIYRLWNESWRRIIILVLVPSMLAAHLPFTTADHTLDSLPDSRICRESSELDEAGPCDSPVSFCCHGTVSYATFSSETVPDGRACCPNDCTKCSRSCCEGMPLLHTPVAKLLYVARTGSIPGFQVCDLFSVYPTDIFHPPRA